MKGMISPPLIQKEIEYMVQFSNKKINPFEMSLCMHIAIVEVECKAFNSWNNLFWMDIPLFVLIREAVDTQKEII